MLNFTPDTSSPSCYRHRLLSVPLVRQQEACGCCGQVWHFFLLTLTLIWHGSSKSCSPFRDICPTIKDLLVLWPWCSFCCFSLIPSLSFQHFQPLFKYIFTGAPRISLMDSTLACIGSIAELAVVSGTGQPLTSSHRGFPWRPSLPKPYHLLPIQ